jgi:hypothetical protein
MKIELTLNRNNWEDLETFVGDINAIAFDTIKGANKGIELEKPHSKYKKIYGFGEIKKEYTVDGDIKYIVHIKDNFFNRSLDILKDMFKPFISLFAIFDGAKFRNLSEDMVMLYSEEEANENE